MDPDRHSARDPVPDRLETTSTTLLQRAKAGEPEAWDRLVRLYAPLVYSWCRRAGMQQADAADVVQEVFRKVAGAIRDFHHDAASGTMRGWLRVITTNAIRDQVRSQRHQPQATGGTDAYQRFQEVAAEESDMSSEQQTPIRAVFHQALACIRAEFEERTWQAFWQVTVDGRTPTDVARDLGLSPATVRQHKCRVLRRLREELGDAE